jgi:hypothetical protein
MTNTLPRLACNDLLGGIASKGDSFPQWQKAFHGDQDLRDMMSGVLVIQRADHLKVRVLPHVTTIPGIKRFVHEN